LNAQIVPGLHEIDPLFRKLTLENERIQGLVRDLKFHRNPVGELPVHPRSGEPRSQKGYSLALQSMVITKQTQIGGEGEIDYCFMKHPTYGKLFKYLNTTIREYPISLASFEPFN